MGINNLYRYDLNKKRYTKSKLQGLVLYWIVYLVFFVFILNMPWLFKLFAIIIAAIGILPILYQLKKGIYLKKGEKYISSKSMQPKDLLNKAKKEAGHGKN